MSGAEHHLIDSCPRTYVVCGGQTRESGLLRLLRTVAVVEASSPEIGHNSDADAPRHGGDGSLEESFGIGPISRRDRKSRADNHVYRLGTDDHRLPKTVGRASGRSPALLSKLLLLPSGRSQWDT